MIWIDKQELFDRALDRVAAESVIAVDTEADSLHSYFDKVCLVQISANGEDLVVDPLSGVKLSKFGEILANPVITKILHGADYDLRIMNRDFGFTVANLVDTSVCAQLLGYEAFGLAALLERHFGVKLNKTHQRADWAMRPLTPEMLDYAALDTRYLVGLADKLREELTALGRWEWALEEFSRLESIRYRENEEPEPWRRMKNLGTLDRRSLAVIRGLYEWRDSLARAADRPPFKIIGNEPIIEIARAKPADAQALTEVKGLPRYHLDRYRRDVLRIVEQAMQIPEEQLPEKNEAKPWIRDRDLERQIDRMKKVRDTLARELKVDTAVLAPRHVLAAIAATGDLDQVPAMRLWQKRLFGAELLAVLKKT